LVDSHVSGRVFIAKDGVRLEIIRSAIVGSLSSTLANSTFVITDSSIKGDVNNRSFGAHSLTITNSSVDGGIAFGFGGVTVDGLTLHGTFTLTGAYGTVARSHISSAGIGAALFLHEDTRYESSIQLEHTFVQGALAVAADGESRLQSSSSVLAGPISASATAVLTCTDTYGGDYELLNAACLPQAP